MTGQTAINLVGWKKVSTWGSDCDIYANGRSRMMIDRHTGEVVIAYQVDDGKRQTPCPGSSQCPMVTALTRANPCRFSSGSAVIQEICLKCSLRDH